MHYSQDQSKFRFWDPLGPIINIKLQWLVTNRCTGICNQSRCPYFWQQTKVNTWFWLEYSIVVTLDVIDNARPETWQRWFHFCYYNKLIFLRAVTHPMCLDHLLIWSAKRTFHQSVWNTFNMLFVYPLLLWWLLTRWMFHRYTTLTQQPWCPP